MQCLDGNLMSGYRIDMRQKVSTIMEPALYRRVKLESVRQGKQISEVVAAALRLYLETTGRGSQGDGVVAETWGAIEIDRNAVQSVLEEEGLLDA